MARKPSKDTVPALRPYTLERADMLAWEMLPGRTPWFVQAARLIWYGGLIFGMGFLKQIGGVPFILELDFEQASTADVLLSAAISFGLFMLWYAGEQLVRLALLNRRATMAAAKEGMQRSVGITEAGLMERAGDTETLHPWDKIPYSFATPIAAYILLSKTAQLIVPVRAFGSSDDMRKFIDIIEQRSNDATP